MGAHGSAWRLSSSRRRGRPRVLQLLPANQETITRYRLRLEREPAPPYEKPVLCERPAAAARLASKLVGDVDREIMGALFLDGRNRAVGHTIAYVGGLSRVTVEPRGLLVPALLGNAAGIVAFHNHPSGDLSPSAEDLAFTRRLSEAAELLGVSLLDHLIIGEPGRFVSLRGRGALPGIESS